MDNMKTNRNPSKTFGIRLSWTCLLCLGLIFTITACGGKRLTQADLHQAYQEALAATETGARSDWTADADSLTAAIDRLREYYREITAESVKRLTRKVYADDAFMCDTLHIARGAAEIEAYFLKSAERAESITVSILDYTASGREVYTRWTMTITAEKLADGKPVTTFGVSHFRFSQDGKVILHQDFWDASAGFFEQVSGLGGILTRIRGSL